MFSDKKYIRSIHSDVLGNPFSFVNCFSHYKDTLKSKQYKKIVKILGKYLKQTRPAKIYVLIHIKKVFLP